MTHKKFGAFKIIGFAICGLAIGALLGWVVMSLWNCILVPVLAVKLITFWQALGILLLSKILFGGFHKSFNGRRQWKENMKEKWQGMNDEEREKFKQEFRNKCKSWNWKNKNSNDVAE
jgi:Ca2+/H+ antiporter, TMEM165/GDT1 family